MAYVDFEALDQYESKIAGAAVEVLIFDANEPAEPLIGAATSINSNENFETPPIEEAGNDGVDEFVQGRHDLGLSIQAFWTPRWSDRVPTRQDFIGKEYTILERISVGRPGAGTVVNAYVGCRINRVGTAHGARGVKTLDLAFVATRRYKGTEWATLTGA